ncbi:hypothetical protein NDU88_003935 [Pleurodeles waltl]|uniref:Uncharacterized protein n=1 Tax=Pleurodeles waltl TaxID=8319 RepID=A0AAV7MVR6_PLEWA|nr:hypothetical protein NDU88_003935 [Pleurodeles waltl]
MLAAPSPSTGAASKRSDRGGAGARQTEEGGVAPPPLGSQVIHQPTPLGPIGDTLLAERELRTSHYSSMTLE